MPIGGYSKHLSRKQKINKMNIDTSDLIICQFTSLSGGKLGKGVNDKNEIINLIFRSCFYRMKTKLKNGIYLYIQKYDESDNLTYEVVKIANETDEPVINFKNKLLSYIKVHDTKNESTGMIFAIINNITDEKQHQKDYVDNLDVETEDITNEKQHQKDYVYNLDDENCNPNRKNSDDSPDYDVSKNNTTFIDEI